MEETAPLPKRKQRILQSTWARLRRQASKFAFKKHSEKEARELESRYEGEFQQQSKEKRHLGKTT